ncbi:MAG TPA: hypothetical protein VEB19_03185 [Gemmatimonadaceae bacterium]|nr:hypothetical protein [Gemmatimonadaceae bacterium]
MTSYPTTGDPTRFVGYSKEARDRIKEETIDAILARVPAADLPRMQEILRPPPDSNEIVVIAAHSDEETARLLGVLHSLAAIDVQEARAASRARPRTRSIGVAIGLVQTLKPDTVRVRVIRRPPRDYETYILLRESDATQSDFAIGIRIAKEMHTRLGRSIDREIVQDFDPTTTDLTPYADLPMPGEVLPPHDELRQSPLQDVPGIGMMRGIFRGILLPPLPDEAE